METKLFSSSISGRIALGIFARTSSAVFPETDEDEISLKIVLVLLLLLFLTVALAAELAVGAVIDDTLEALLAAGITSLIS